jgi:integrase/recombinase XerD
MDLLEKYRENLKSVKVPKSYSEDTIDSYCNDIKKFLNYVAKDMSDVTSDDIARFLLKDAPATGRRRFSSVLNFYDYLNKNGITDNKPIVKEDYDNLVRPDPERLIDRMTIPEGLLFLDTAKADGIRTFAIMMTYLNTGVREDELCSVLRENYHVETNIHGKAEATLRIIGKGNKERILPVNDGTIEALNDYFKMRKDDIPYLFTSNHNRHYSSSGMYSLVKEVASKSGIKKDIYPHILRHTFAAMMWDQGVDPVQIMYLLGHSNIKTTLRYLGRLGIKKAQDLLKSSAFNIR